MFVKFHIKTAITGLNKLVRVTLEQSEIMVVVKPWNLFRCNSLMKLVYRWNCFVWNSSGRLHSLTLFHPKPVRTLFKMIGLLKCWTIEIWKQQTCFRIFYKIVCKFMIIMSKVWYFFYSDVDVLGIVKCFSKTKLNVTSTKALHGVYQLFKPE